MSTLIKYPRTRHAVWSRTVGDDDKVHSSMDHFQGREVVVTEKMDGECMLSSTHITMADGTQETIGSIVRSNGVGKYVMGVDQYGICVPSKITKVYYNGTTEDWLSVNVKGSHSKYTSIRCTPSHKFFSDNEYKCAKDLKSGDKVKILETHQQLSDLQKEVMLGKLLGDGHLYFPSSPNTENYERAMVVYSHKQDHQEYLEWTNTFLGNSSNPKITKMVSGYGSNMVRSATKSLYDIHRTFSIMKKKNEAKQVPLEILELASAATLAFWYMDDGQRQTWPTQRDRIIFSVCGFDLESCKVLMLILEKFKIKSKIKNYEGYNYIVVNADNTHKFFGIISPYVPPCMEYKLSEKFRKGVKYVPKTENLEPIRRLRETYIVDIKPYLHNSDRGKYDIETETHNYLANNVLVHNCTTFYSDHYHARSIDGRHHPSRDMVKQIWGNVRYMIPENWRVCGENMYAKHSIEYNDLPSYFMGFSVWDDTNTKLAYDDGVAFMQSLGLNTVPELWRGVYDENAIKQLWSDKDYNRSEGYVIQVVDAIAYDDFGKYVAKFVRPKHVQSSEHWMNQHIVPNKLKR